MNTTHTRRQSLSTPLAVLALGGALLAVACANEVHDPYGNDGNNLGACSGDDCPGETSGGNVTPPPASQAVAMLYSEVNWDVGGGSGSSSVSTTSGTGIDPNTLYVFIHDDAASCSDPFAAMPCGSHWSVTVAIPPHLQQPGVISLSDPSLISTFSATGPGSGDDCYFGGGSYDGDLEIVSINNTEVVVRLANTDKFEFDADGEYTAPRCVSR